MGSVSVDGPYHLNMWGVDDQNEEVLFTHDHTHARGLGGRDILDNSETMCCFCNWEKGVQEQILHAEFTKAKHKAAKEAKAKLKDLKNTTSSHGYWMLLGDIGND